jgi:hypothetical protein
VKTYRNVALLNRVEEPWLKTDSTFRNVVVIQQVTMDTEGREDEECKNKKLD